MKINVDKITTMSATERMAFVKECCKGNNSISKSIQSYAGCVLDWAKEVNGYIVFTVRAGSYDGTSVRDANEFITISFNKNTGEFFCLS